MTDCADEPTVTEPDEVFTVTDPDGKGQAGVSKGVSPSCPACDCFPRPYAAMLKTQALSCKMTAGCILRQITRHHMTYARLTQDPTEGVTLNPSGVTGRKMLRTLLQAGLTPDTLDLSGDGESVGDSTAGADGKAYGHGTSTGVGQGGTHIEVSLQNSAVVSSFAAAAVKGFSMRVTVSTTPETVLQFSHCRGKHGMSTSA